MSPRAQLLGAALAFSTGGAAIKACGFDALQVAGLRSLLGACVLLVWLPGTRRGWSRGVFGVAVAYAAMMIAFVAANKLTTAANAIFLQSTFPIYTLALGPWVLGERRRTSDLGVLALCGLGLALVAMGEDAPSAVATHPWWGNVVAAVSGVLWAVTILGLRALARHGEGSGAGAAAVVGNLLTAAIALPLAWPLETGTPTDWAWMLWLGVVQIGLAYVLMTRSLTRLGALEASFLLLVEPVVSPVWAWVVHREVPTGLALLGGAVIVGALALRLVLQARGTSRTG